MVALSLRLEGEEDERAAVAVLRAARLLTGGGRLALAAALRRGSRLGLQVRIDLLKFSVFAAGPATEMLGHVGTLGGLEAAADAAFNPEDTADWLQLATSGLLSCCTGARWRQPCRQVRMGPSLMAPNTRLPFCSHCGSVAGVQHCRESTCMHLLAHPTEGPSAPLFQQAGCLACCHAMPRHASSCFIGVASPSQQASAL